MHIQEKRNLTYRIVSGILLFLTLGLDIFAIIHTTMTEYEDKPLTIVAIVATMAFCLFEIIVLLRGGKKDSNLYKIAFIENGDVNKFPMVVVIVGTVLGLGLIGLGLGAYFLREEENIKTSMLVIMSIATFLTVNCLIYFLYLIMFRKREFKLEDLLK